MHSSMHARTLARTLPPRALPPPLPPPIQLYTRADAPLNEAARLVDSLESEVLRLQSEVSLLTLQLEDARRSAAPQTDQPGAAARQRKEPPPPPEPPAELPHSLGSGQRGNGQPQAGASQQGKQGAEAAGQPSGAVREREVQNTPEGQKSPDVVMCPWKPADAYSREGRGAHAAEEGIAQPQAAAV
jgi:hypothetical protein